MAKQISVVETGCNRVQNVGKMFHLFYGASFYHAFGEILTEISNNVMIDTSAHKRTIKNVIFGIKSSENVKIHQNLYIFFFFFFENLISKSILSLPYMVRRK